MAAIALVSYSNLAVSAGLPSIGDDLGNVSLVPWVITVELLAAAIAILGIGPVVDSQGVRQVFRLSMIGFIIASLACAAAPTMVVLVIGRVAQGITAGGVIGSAVSSVGLGFPVELRPRAFAAVSAVWGVMGIGGPAIAAVLISTFGWRSIFAITLPIGAIATAIGWNHLPGRRDDTEDVDFDRAGLVFVGLATIGLLLGASAGSAVELLWFVPAVVAMAVYVRHSRTMAAPVVRLKHLGGRRWRYLHISATLAVAGGTGANVFLPLYLRGARGASESAAAFSVLFLVIGWSVASYVSSKAQERMHAAYVVRAGAGLLIMAMITATALVASQAPLPLLMLTLFFVGCGVGSITTSGITILQGRASDDEMGRVTSAHQFVRSLGFAYGAAVGGAMLFFVVARQIGDVEAIRDLLGGESTTLNADAVAALQDGFAWALAASSLFTLIAAGAAIMLVRSIGMFTPNH